MGNEVDIKFSTKDSILLLKIENKNLNILEVYRKYNEEYDLAGFLYEGYLMDGISGKSYFHHRLEVTETDPDQWSKGSYHSMSKVVFRYSGEHSTIVSIPVYIVQYGVEIGNGIMNWAAKTVAYITQMDYQKLLS